MEMLFYTQLTWNTMHVQRLCIGLQQSHEEKNSKCCPPPFGGSRVHTLVFIRSCSRISRGLDTRPSQSDLSGSGRQSNACNQQKYT